MLQRANSSQMITTPLSPLTPKHAMPKVVWSEGLSPADDSISADDSSPPAERCISPLVLTPTTALGILTSSLSPASKSEQSPRNFRTSPELVYVRRALSPVCAASAEDKEWDILQSLLIPPTRIVLDAPAIDVSNLTGGMRSACVGLSSAETFDYDGFPSVLHAELLGDVRVVCLQNS